MSTTYEGGGGVGGGGGGGGGSTDIRVSVNMYNRKYLIYKIMRIVKKISYHVILNLEPRHEKILFFHLRKQWRRSAAQ